MWDKQLKIKHLIVNKPSLFINQQYNLRCLLSPLLFGENCSFVSEQKAQRPPAH